MAAQPVGHFHLITLAARAAEVFLVAVAGVLEVLLAVLGLLEATTAAVAVLGQEYPKAVAMALLGS